MAVQEKIKDPFIYVEDNVLPADVCEEIIRRFEKNKHEHKQGAIGKGIDTQVKDSMDLQISRWMEFFDISCALSGVVQEALPKYHKYCQRITRKSFTTGEDIPMMVPMPELYISEHQVQKTLPGKGYTWHSDAHLGRVLTYIFYLNDVEEGWTEFLQGDKIAPKQGRLLIFPSDWTYYHQGFPPKTDKYISIGWASCYQPY